MNNLWYTCTLSMGLFVWMTLPNALLAQNLPPAPLPPLTYQTFKRLQARPELLKPQLASPKPSGQTASLPAGPSPWRPLSHQPPFNPGAMLLLTDGTVMVHDQGVKNSGASGWWRLTPNVNGSYLNGTWSKLASLPAGYAPLYFATGVLPDGRVIIEGGQYNNGQLVFTNLGAIYDPLINKWTKVQAPSGKEWSMIGAAAGTVLANGTFMIGGVFTSQQALFYPAKLSWKIVTESGKADTNDEETWTLLPNGNVLTVDTNNPCNLKNSELFLPHWGRWDSAGSTIAKLVDVNADNSGTHETGPQVLRPDGTVFATGYARQTAVYDSVKGTWTPGPLFPDHFGIADGPAAVLPSGNVLVVASPGIEPQTPPAHFFVFDGVRLQQIVGPPNAASLAAYYGFMIVLPTGEIMFNSRLGDIELFADTGAIARDTAPVIAHIELVAESSGVARDGATAPPAPIPLIAGKRYILQGRRLNGVSQAAAYAEGYQPATNYPLIRIVNSRTKHVFYARTFDHSGRSVAHEADLSTHFTVPAGIETGAATLFAVANGIASKPVSVTVAKK